MQYLNYDVQIHIFSYLQPEEIIGCSELISNELLSHVGFQVYCKSIISQETLLWFQQKKIKIHLFQEMIVQSNGIQIWYQNGLKHRDENLPAEIWDNGTQKWYQHGQLHRDNDLPAEIIIEPVRRSRIKRIKETHIWYQHGKMYRDNNLSPHEVFYRSILYQIAKK